MGELSTFLLIWGDMRFAIIIHMHACADKIGGQDCSIQNVLNIIALYSEWYDIGLHLQLPPHDLEFIEKSYKPEEYHVRLVELWWRTHKLTWEKLRSALRELLRAQQPQKESTSSQVVSLSPLVFEHPPPPDQTEGMVIKHHKTSSTCSLQNPNQSGHVWNL